MNRTTFNSLVIRSTIAVAVGLVPCSFAVAQAPSKTEQPASKKQTATASPPTIDQFMKIRAPGSPTLGPDGTLYLRDWPDGVNQLYKRPSSSPTAPMIRMTNFPDGLSGYSLSPDGAKIIAAAAVGGNEQDQLYLIDPKTNDLKPLLQDPAVVFSLQCWLPDSSGFIYTANDTSAADFHIYRYDFKDGKKTKLLGKTGSWNASDITNDGSRALVNEYLSESQAHAYELNTTTGELTSLNIGDGYNSVGGYLPDENSVTVVSDQEEGINRLFVRDLATGKTTKPLPQIDKFPVEGGAVNEDRTVAVVQYNEGGYGSMMIVKLPSFKVVELPEQEKGVIGTVDVRGKAITWTLSNARIPGLAYSFDLEHKAEPKQLTQAETQGIDLNKFTLPKLITYKSFDGVEIPAFLYLPPNYTPGAGTPIPFVINFHGGPEGQSRPGFTSLTQYLLANGFGVMQPNIRGSTGYGRDFHMMDNYKKRWDSVKDGVEAARWLVKNDYAKAGKIAAYGGSYGGFMAVATVIEGADVFGAAVDVVGIVNMKTFLEKTKDYRRKLREAEYGPLSDPEFLASISPINRIDEIKCEMLIAHGANDPRVPVGEAMQLAVGLQKRGYDPELIFCPDEGHGFAKLENRLLFANRMVKFLQRTIGDLNPQTDQRSANPTTPDAQTAETKPQEKTDVYEAIAKAQRGIRDLNHFLKRSAQSLAEIAGNPSNSSQNMPTVGYVGTFQIDVAASRADMARYDQFLIAKDDIGMKGMEDRGEILWYSGEARIIQVLPQSKYSAFYYCELRLLEGPLANSSMWASIMDVQ